MRLAIKGKEINVVLTSERDLSTQEIISAYQLSTGNFEALFINNDTSDETEKEEVATATESDQPAIGEYVKVEVMCPFCGFTGKTGTRWGNSFCKCPSCSEKLYNKFSTGIKGETNSYGCHYLADEPMIFKNENDEFRKQMGEEK